MTLLSLASSAFGGEYVIEKGGDAPVCLAYRDNLNALKPRERALGCAQRNKAVTTDISFPTWESINSLDDLSFLLPKLWRYSWRRDVNQAAYHDFTTGEWTGSKRQKASAYVRFENYMGAKGTIYGDGVGLVDIDNDGKPENVYLDLNCTTHGAIPYILNAARNDIDVKKTNQISKHLDTKDQKASPFRKPQDGEFVPPQPDALKAKGLVLTEDAYRTVDYNIFFFKGKTYFDFWRADPSDLKFYPHSDARRLRVFLAIKNAVEKVCQYRFDSKH